MDATESNSGGNRPSEALSKVRRVIAELGAAVDGAPTMMMHDDEIKGQLTGFVSDFKAWYEGGGDVPMDLDHVNSLEPRHQIGDATIDVLLYFHGIYGDIKKLWPCPLGEKAPSAGKGLLLPALFHFFGFFNLGNVTSAGQLYNQALYVNKELAKELAILRDDDARTLYLHGPCFVKPRAPRSSALSLARKRAPKSPTVLHSPPPPASAEKLRRKSSMTVQTTEGAAI